MNKIASIDILNLVINCPDCLPHLILKFNERELCYIVSKNIDCLKKFEHPSERICLSAIQTNGDAISRIRPNQINERMCVAAVRQNYTAIKNIQNPSLEVSLFAVRQNGMIIKEIKGDVPDEVKLTAVAHCELAIYEIHHPSEEMLRIAARNKNVFDFKHSWQKNYQRLRKYQ